MQYTVRQIVDHLLRYLTQDERIIPPIPGKESDGRAKEALIAINGALQELYTLSKAWISSSSMGELINAPVTVVVTVTRGSRTASTAGWLSWMEGCTIRITGDPNDNEVIEPESAGSFQLRNPSALTGPVSATIYHDCIDLPGNVREIRGPVSIPGIGELRPSAGEKDLHSKSHGLNTLNNRDYGFTPFGTEREVFGGHQPVGDPGYYWLDTSHSSIVSPRYRLKIMPMPTAERVVEYRARVTPPAYGVEDVWQQGQSGSSGTADDPGTLVPAPHDFTESVIIPIAAQRFKASPYFRNDSAAAEISRQYEVAMDIIKETSPQPLKGFSIMPPY